jgi:hypothetical protein
VLRSAKALWLSVAQRCSCKRSERERAMNFAKSMLRGEKDRAAIIKTVIADRIREVV